MTNADEMRDRIAEINAEIAAARVWDLRMRQLLGERDSLMRKLARLGRS